MRIKDLIVFENKRIDEWLNFFEEYDRKRIEIVMRNLMFILWVDRIICWNIFNLILYICMNDEVYFFGSFFWLFLYFYNM